MPSDGDHRLIVPAQADQVRRVTQFVGRIARAAGFAESQLSQIELAVDEACSNIIQHAYTGRDDGNISITVQVEPNRKITISLIDDGVPFDPWLVPEHNPAVPLDDLKIGGLGLYLMRQMMDELRFEFGLAGIHPTDPKRYNRLTMTKTL